MNVKAGLIFIVGLIATCLFGGPLSAQDSQTPKTISLFDGQTLNGWDGDPKFWSIQDGAITGTTTKDNPTKGNTFCIFKNGDFEDFELTLKFRIEGHNSGIQFRSFPLEGAADQWRLGGYQADFDVKNKWSGTLFGEKFRGVLAKRGENSTITGATSKQTKKGPKLIATREIQPIDGAEKLAEHVKAYPEWNDYKIVAEGYNFKLYINDHLMSECTDEDKENRMSKGLLGLQLHGGPPMKVQFKDILITPMTIDESATSAATEDLVFTEDFESGLDHWEIINSESWDLQEHGRGKSLSIIRRQSDYKPEVRSPRHIALVKGLEAASFEITFDVKSTNDTGDHRDCCVFFNYQNPTNYYYTHLGAKPDPNSGQIFIVKNEPRKNLTNNEKLIGWTDDWHKVKVVRDAESGDIQVYFDDMENPHLEVNDKRFGKGRIGIGSFDDMNAFDNIKIEVK